MTDLKSDILKMEEFLSNRYDEIISLYARQQAGEDTGEEPVIFYGKRNAETQTPESPDTNFSLAEVEKHLFSLDTIYQNLKLTDIKLSNKTAVTGNKLNAQKSEVLSCFKKTYEIFLIIKKNSAVDYKGELELCIKIGVLCEQITIKLALDLNTDLTAAQIFKKSLTMQLFYFDKFADTRVLRQILQCNDTYYREVKLMHLRKMSLTR